jgi:hypothetical protein
MWIISLALSMSKFVEHLALLNRVKHRRKGEGSMSLFWIYILIHAQLQRRLLR